MDLESFKNIPDTMVWRQAALDQIAQFNELADRLLDRPGASVDHTATVVGSHRSKSIVLPVVQLVLDGFRFLLRDNFHDMNLCVLAPRPVNLSLHALLHGAVEEHDWSWYLSEIARCRGYTWRYFSDEEMGDPLTLVVWKQHEHGGNVMEWKVSLEQKIRWLCRLTDPSWWKRDWAGSTLCWEGEFEPGVVLLIQRNPFAEGIESLVPSDALQPYRPGVSQFALAVHNMEASETIIRRVVQA